MHSEFRLSNCGKLRCGGLVPVREQINQAGVPGKRVLRATADPTRAGVPGKRVLRATADPTRAGVFPVRLKADEWQSGDINWLFDVIAPNQKLTTSVIANFRQIVKEGDLRIHPLVTRLVDAETLKKMGAAPVDK